MRFLGRSVVGLFLLALTAGLLGYAGYTVSTAMQERMERQSRPIDRRERVIAAKVLTVTPQAVRPRMQVIGEVQSRRTLDIRAQATGAIEYLDPSVVNGGTVSAGTLLIRIDPTDAQAALTLAQADLADTQAESRDAARALDLARDDLEAAHKAAELRRQAHQRQLSLMERGVGTDAALETAALALSTAEQTVLQKRQAILQAEARVDRATTALSRRQVNLDDARRRLDNTQVFAAFDGVLSDVAVVEGGHVTQNERMARLVDPGALDVAFQVSNAQFARMVDGNGALIQSDVTASLDLLGASIQASGRITRVNATVGDGQTGRQVFASLDPASATDLRPGDFLTVTIIEPELRGVAVLPASAVDSNGKVLVLGQSDRLEELQATVLRHQGDDVIVRATPLVGREVVAVRSPLLGAGVRVKPVRTEEEEQAQAPELMELDAARRAKLVAFVEGNGFIPDNVKERILGRLAEDKVPVRLVERLESRMGG